MVGGGLNLRECSISYIINVMKRLLCKLGLHDKRYHLKGSIGWMVNKPRDWDGKWICYKCRKGN